MKKCISLILMGLLTFSLMACGSSKDSEETGDAPQKTQQTAAEDAQKDDAQEDDAEETGEADASELTTDMFDKTASIEETVMYEGDGLKITATGLTFSNYSVDLELLVENSSSKNLSVVSGSLSSSCNAVNGYMIEAGYLNCDVAAGKSTNASVSFGYEALMLYGINEVADIEVGFDISDEEYNHVYTGPCQVLTSSHDAHDYTVDTYPQTITSQAAMNTFGYEMTCFSEDSLYEQNGVKLLSSGIMVNQNGEALLLLELENTTDQQVYLTTSSIALNGLLAYSSDWSNNAINPGTRGFISVNTASVLAPAYWEALGIRDLGSISLAVTQKNSDGDVIADAATVEVAVPDAAAEYDAAGQEVYSNNGFRLVAKTVLEDPDDYSCGLHVLLLAENNSGSTLKIDDDINSLSINGFMMDYFCSAQEIPDGSSALVDIEVLNSSLEDNHITSASEVKDLEISFTIKAGREDFDTPTVQFSF